MITIETDHSVTGIQSIAGETLGYQVGVSQAGRLGQEVTLTSKQGLPAFLAALREGDHQAVVTVRANGRKAMRPKSLRVSDELWDAAQEKADERGEVLSEVLRNTLERYVKRA